MILALISGKAVQISLTSLPFKHMIIVTRHPLGRLSHTSVKNIFYIHYIGSYMRTRQTISKGVVCYQSESLLKKLLFAHII